MDPHSGKLYTSLKEARADGVHDPVEIFGTRKNAERISKAVAEKAAAERKKARRKSTRASRKRNR